MWKKYNVLEKIKGLLDVTQTFTDKKMPAGG